MGRNTIFSGKLSKGKLKATVIKDIWPELLFFTLLAIGEWAVGHLRPYGVLSLPLSTPVVSAIDRSTNVKLGFNNQLLTVLGVVLGLAISFRTTTAYER